jgi:hypothetical protein
METTARPWPLLGPSHKAAGNRILVDVIELVTEIGSAAKDKVEITRLPYGTPGSPDLRDRECGFALPVTHQHGERRLKHSEQQVHMVGHHHICEKAESVLCTSLSYVLEADVTFTRSKGKNAARQIRGDKEIPSGMFDPAEARHAGIIM